MRSAVLWLATTSAHVCTLVSCLLLYLFEQVLDLSSNEFSAEGVGVIADATRNAAGLRQLRLLGNKIPFGLDTLRKLMQVGTNGMDRCWGGTGGLFLMLAWRRLLHQYTKLGWQLSCCSVPVVSAATLSGQ